MGHVSKRSSKRWFFRTLGESYDMPSFALDGIMVRGKVHEALGRKQPQRARKATDQPYWNEKLSYKGHLYVWPSKNRDQWKRFEE